MNTLKIFVEPIKQFVSILSVSISAFKSRFIRVCFGRLLKCKLGKKTWLESMTVKASTPTILSAILRIHQIIMTSKAGNTGQGSTFQYFVFIYISNQNNYQPFQAVFRAKESKNHILC